MAVDILKKAIAKILSVYIKEIELESTFYGDLGADSIDLVQIIRCVEEDLDISIGDIPLDEIETVGDLLKLIEEYTD